MQTHPNVSDLIGTPFSKMKCWDLVVEVERRFGNSVPSFDVKGSLDASLIAGIVGQQESCGRWERIERPEPGCIVAMSLEPEYPDAIQHFGVYLRRNFIHSSRKQNVVITPIDHPFYAKKIRGYFKWVS
ncbi:MAG: hypothetical protein CSYNP_01582 [Syntrophus sp. SKADARSKE-3]|nr:hypothetical protein [Syntrophus sp. SKADARSKE-3]